MQTKAIEGVVENGTIRLRGDVALPENTRVYVIVADQTEDRTARIRSPRLAHPELSADFKKQIVELPGDAKV
jgi:hypothetical protein